LCALVLAGVAQFVIGLAFFRVGQHVVGLVDLGHALLGIGLLADIRVVLARQLAERFLDLVGAGVFGHAQSLVVVLVIHCRPP
jgi:hypothetical protein